MSRNSMLVFDSMNEELMSANQYQQIKNYQLIKQEQSAFNLFLCAMSRIMINNYCGEIDLRRVLIMPFFLETI